MVSSETALVQIYAHECDECDFKTDSQSYFKNHIVFRHLNEGRIYRCDLCPQTFAFPDGVKRHKEELHTTGNLLKCSFCDYISVPQNIRRHENKHRSPDARVTCNHCGKSILKLNIVSHRAKHYKDKVKDPALLIFKCTKCDYKTDKRKPLNMHMVNKHPVSVLNCDFCKYSTPFETKLDVHVARKHTTKRNCEDCSFETTSKNEMTNHKKKYHESICNKCDFQTKSEVHLRVHKQKGHSEPISCDICKYGCKSVEEYIEHREDEHDRPFIKCNVCDYIATSKGNLRQHAFEHHNCTKCSFLAKTKDELISHNERSHSYRCAKCNLNFSEKTFLKKHVSKAHGKKLKGKGSEEAIKLEDNVATNNGKSNIEEYFEEEDIKEEETQLGDKAVVDVDVGAVIDHPTGATYVCPLNSCTFFTTILTDKLLTAHFITNHSDVDTSGVKFLTLL